MFHNVTMSQCFTTSQHRNRFTQSFAALHWARFPRWFDPIRVRGVDTKLHSMGISVGQLPVAQLQFEQLERNNWRVQETTGRAGKTGTRMGCNCAKKKGATGCNDRISIYFMRFLDSERSWESCRASTLLQQLWIVNSQENAWRTDSLAWAWEVVRMDWNDIGLSTLLWRSIWGSKDSKTIPYPRVCASRIVGLLLT